MDVATRYRRLFLFTRNSPAAFVQLLLGVADKATLRRIIACPTYPVPVRTAEWRALVAELSDALREQTVSGSLVLGSLYVAARSLVHRKRHGQFFTSPDLARWAVQQSNMTDGEDVLDAGSGPGAFGEAIIQLGVRVNSYTGVENDPALALANAVLLESLSAPPSFRVWYANFLTISPASLTSHGSPRPSTVIGNPPFVRFHNLVGRSKLTVSLKETTGIQLSALSGSSNFFVLRAADLSARDGASVAAKITFFLPREAAGSAHASRLRADLATCGWSWRQLSVPDSTANGDRRGSGALGLLFVFERSAPPVVGARRKTLASTVSDVMNVHRGISTGRNDFFVLSDAEARRRKIPERWLRRTLPTRIPLPGDVFSESDWQRYADQGHSCWLLVLPNIPLDRFETSVMEYLREGIRRGLHKTATAQRLAKWYSLPTPSRAADVFVTYLFRGAPRFILNADGILNLTNILGGTFRRPLSRDNMLEAVRQMNLQALRWDAEGLLLREYRDGLRKLEPRELLRLPINKRIRDAFGVSTSVNATLFE